MVYKKCRKTHNKKCRVTKQVRKSKLIRILEQQKEQLLEPKEILETKIEKIDLPDSLLEDSQSLVQNDTVVIEVELNDDKDLSKKSAIEDILFKLPIVKMPLIGTPKQAQKELDAIALKIQRRPNLKSSRALFDKIHLYMHGYLINIVLKQFPYIKGLQTTDIYQQTLIALWSKALPNFKTGRGMSFLNFAKMCIRRHLITLLNTSKTRQKDQSINQAVSLDSCTPHNDDDSVNSYSNVIPDNKESADKKASKEEAFAITRNTLMDFLSEFERIVLNEYLSTSTYKEIATNISKKTKARCVPKSVDNALLRIRKKATYLKRHGKIEEIPLFIV